jgi:ketosteroid isomerase-like protein
MPAPKPTRARGIAAAGAALLLSATAAADDASYAADRAAIEDLQARYLFALDFGDGEAYASTFTEDGVLDWGAGEIKGREAIADVVRNGGPPEQSGADADLRPAAGRHNITNIVLEIDGDTAVGRAYWFHMGNDNPERAAQLNSFGHYEDELRKVDGEWLFSRRVIYNEQVADWSAAGNDNPAW